MTPERDADIERICHAALRARCRRARGVSRGSLRGRRGPTPRGRIAARAGICGGRLHEHAGARAGGQPDGR